MRVKNSTIRKLIVVTMIFFSLSKRLKRRKVVVNLISHTWLNVVKNKVCLSKPQIGHSRIIQHNHWMIMTKWPNLVGCKTEINELRVWRSVIGLIYWNHWSHWLMLSLRSIKSTASHWSKQQMPTKKVGK